MANEKYGIEGFSFAVKLMWVEIENHSSKVITNKCKNYCDNLRTMTNNKDGT